MTRGKIVGVIAALLLGTLSLVTPPAEAATGAVDVKLGSATLVAVAGGGSSAVYGARSLQCGGTACYHLVEVLAPSANTTSGQTTDLATLASVPQQIVTSTAGSTTTVVVAETLGVEVFTVTNSIATCQAIVLTSLGATTTPGASCTGSGGPTPKALLSSSPVLAVAADGGTFYALHSDGTVDSYNSSSPTAPVNAVVSDLSPIANYSGGAAGFVLSGSYLYAARTIPSGTASSATGDVAKIPTSGGAVTDISLGPNQPTALAAGGSYVYAAGSLGITPIDPSGAQPSSGTPASALVAYPSTTVSCATLSYTTATGGPFLYCAPQSTADRHVYRFNASHPFPTSTTCSGAVPDPCRSSLAYVGGAPTANVPKAVVGAPWGAYLLSAGAFTSVDNASISTLLQSGSLPQPPLDVRSYARVNDQGDPIILVVWDAPASDFTIDGYYAVATGGGVTSQCGTPNVNGAGDEYCIVSGVTAGISYTATVQSRNSAGLSAPVAAPAVNAGSPMPPGVTLVDTNDDGIPDDAGDTGTITTPSTYVITSQNSVQVTWPLFDPSVSSSNGVNAISSYVATGVDTSTANGSGRSCTWLSTTGATIPPASAGAPTMASCTITGLPAGKTIRVQVAANNTPGAAGVAPNTKWTGAPVVAVPYLSDPTYPMRCADGGTAASEATYVPGAIRSTNPNACGYANPSAGIDDPTFVAGVAPGPDPATISADVFPASPVRNSTSTPSRSPEVPSVAIGSGQILVGWTPKTNYPSLNVSGFQASAYYFDASGKQVTKSCTVTGNQLPQNTGQLSCVISGLTNGLQYYVTVQARTTVLGPPSQYVGTVTPHGPPAAPTKAVVTVPPLSTTDKIGMKAAVSWTAPGDTGGAAITGYLVTATKNPAPAVPENPVICVDGTISASLLASVVPAGMPYPTNLAGAATATGSTDSDAKIDAGDGSVTATGTHLAGGVTTPNSVPKLGCELDGVTSQTGWTVTIRAFNQYGAGALSAASGKFTPNGAPQPPAKVTVKANPNTATVNAAGTLTVTWTAPSFQGGAPISSYDVTVWTPAVIGPGGTITTPATAVGHCSTTALTCTVGSIATGYSYYATVVAYNQVALTPPAGPTLHASDPSAPSATVAMYGKPTVVDVTSATAADRSIFVTWNPYVTADGDPSDPTFGEGPITAYVVTATAGSLVKTMTVTAPATSANLTGLTNGMKYVVTVAAQNAGLTGFAGTYQDPVDASAGLTTYVVPGTVPAAVTTISVRAYSTGADIWWTAPTNTGGVPIDKYTVTAVPGGVTCQAATPAGCALSGLTNGLTYTVTVVATNKFGDSPASKASTAFTPIGLPSPPGIPTAYPSPRGSDATVTWLPSQDAGGGTILSYTVTAKPVTPGAGVVVTCTSNGTPAVPAKGSTPAKPAVAAPTTCDLTGLTNGADYKVTVIATNEGGESAPSANSVVFRPQGPPSPPKGVHAYSTVGREPADGGGSLYVDWQAPDNTGGYQIIKYVATATPGDLWCQAVPTTPGDDPPTTCRIDGLTDGTAYTVTVTAINLLGESDPSAASPVASPAGAPAAPRNVGAVAGQNSVTVKWRPGSANGAPIKQYFVHVMPGNRVVIVAATARSAVIDGLKPGRGYRFQVQANNVVGTSGLSVLTKKVKPLATPERVAKPRATVRKVGRRSTVTVHWKKVATHGGAKVLRYVVQLKGGRSKRVAAKKTSVAFPNLKPGTYRFTVRAVNRNGAGKVSKPVSITVR